jgi:hypothetical protein
MRTIFDLKYENGEIFQVGGIRLGVKSAEGFSSIMQVNLMAKTVELRRYVGILKEGVAIPENVRELYHIMQFGNKESLESLIHALVSLKLAWEQEDANGVN